MKKSRRVYAPSGVSSFFEICDRTPEGLPIRDPQKVGARGGGFIIEKGTTTFVISSKELVKDEIVINGAFSPEAATSLDVIRLIRENHPIPPVRVSHTILPPIGQGFGTSGAGALSTSIAISDAFDLKFSLSTAASYAHRADIEAVTGLGTVISLASATGAIGLVTEPGGYSVGRTDAIMADYEEYTLVCVALGAVKKSTVLANESARARVNEYGRKTLTKILAEPTPKNLLKESRLFAEKTGLATAGLLKLCDKALAAGAIGSSANMIGNAVHCLVEKDQYPKFIERFEAVIPKGSLFESDLIQSGPRILS